MPQTLTIVDPSLSRLRFDEGIAPLAESPTHASMGIRVIEREYPVLVVGLYWKAAGVEVRLRVQADNYDYLPPRGWWVGEDGLPLPADRVPSGGGFQKQSNPYGEDRGWLCFPGWREYHDHQSHQDNPWPPLRRRREYGLSALIVQLWHDLNSAGVEVP